MANFLEMGCGAVELGGCLVAILLIDKDGSRVAVDKVGNIGHASGLLSGGGGEFGEEFADLLKIVWSKAHADGEADHW